MCIWGTSARKAITRHVASEEQITYTVTLWPCERHKGVESTVETRLAETPKHKWWFQMVALSFPMSRGEECWLGHCLT